MKNSTDLVEKSLELINGLKNLELHQLCLGQMWTGVSNDWVKITIKNMFKDIQSSEGSNSSTYRLIHLALKESAKPSYVLFILSCGSYSSVSVSLCVCVRGCINVCVPVLRNEARKPLEWLIGKEGPPSLCEPSPPKPHSPNTSLHVVTLMMYISVLKQEWIAKKPVSRQDNRMALCEMSKKPIQIQDVLCDH